jgi:hypothetical protein
MNTSFFSKNQIDRGAIKNHQIHRSSQVPLQGSAQHSSEPIQSQRRLGGIQHRDIDIALAVPLAARQAAVEIGADEVSVNVVASFTKLLHKGVFHSLRAHHLVLQSGCQRVEGAPGHVPLATQPGVAQTHGRSWH